MDIIGLAVGSISSYSLMPDSRNRNAFKFRPCCSRKDSKRQPQQNGNDKNEDRNGDDRLSTDWDKAWSSFRKQGKKTLFSQFSPDKYVSWNPSVLTTHFQRRLIPSNEQRRQASCYGPVRVSRLHWQ